jgi:hypothetical protein
MDKSGQQCVKCKAWKTLDQFCTRIRETTHVSQIFTFSLYLSWSRAGAYPDARPAPIIPPDAPSRLDGGDAPLPLMRLMR